MGERAIAFFAVAAMIAGSIPPAAYSQSKSKPTYKSLALCLAAYERENSAGMEANARLTKAKFNSSEERTAMEEQSKHFRQASIIKQVCDEMERAERPMADQVKELAGLLDGLGPTGGSVRAPVAGAIRQHNLTETGKRMEQSGETLDQALADFRASDFGGSLPNARSPALVGKRDPALGAAAASGLRADIAQWNREEATREAERQRLAAIEAERRRMQMAALSEQRRIQAEREAEEQASKGSGFWDALGVIAGVGLGIVAARSGGGSQAQTSQALQNYANAQAMANMSRPSVSIPNSGESSCSLSSSDFDPEPPSTGNMCQDARATLAWFQREESRARSCGNAQLVQYHQENMKSARDYAASVC